MRSAFVLSMAALALAWATSGGARAGGKDKEAAKLTPAEAARKALSQKVTIDYVGNSLEEVVNHLRERTKINFVLEHSPFDEMGFGPGGPGGPGGGVQFTFKATGVRLRQALHAFLAPYRLSYVVMADRVLITENHLAVPRQLAQRVSLDLDTTPLSKALKQLSRETGANIVIDPAVKEQAGKELTLQLDDTSLETAVRLLTELAGAKSVRLGEVLFVTTEAKGGRLRKENAEEHRHGDGIDEDPLPRMGFPGFGPRGGRGGGRVWRPIVPPPAIVPPAPPPAKLPE
jgi:type II secretory pathway component GspD/PulD (secretin)